MKNEIVVNGSRYMIRVIDSTHIFMSIMQGGKILPTSAWHIGQLLPPFREALTVAGFLDSTGRRFITGEAPTTDEAPPASDPGTPADSTGEAAPTMPTDDAPAWYIFVEIRQAGHPAAARATLEYSTPQNFTEELAADETGKMAEIIRAVYPINTFRE